MNDATSGLKVIQLCLLGLVLLAMEACMFRAQPLYHPLSQGSAWDEYRQGYFEYQIDDRTYLIGYSNYVTVHAILEGDWYVRSLKWLKGAQEYALYRAAEFTKNKGQQSFVVLHKDDWHYTGYVPASGGGKYSTPRHLRASPGAWVMIRIVDANAAALVKDDNRVYSADTALARLAQENGGLAAYQVVAASANVTGHSISPIFHRWRSSSSAYDSVPVPEVPREELWGPEYTKIQPDSTVTQTAPGKFTVAVWASDQISPIEMLLRCQALARNEGYKAFTIEKWVIEEHVGSKVHAGKVWFRDTVDVALRHEKGTSNLEPVFDVDELSSHMDTNGVLFPR